MVTRLQRHVGAQIETAHGEDIAALFDIYVGRAHLYYNPKIRLERLIYRGIREAQNASRSVEQRERARRVTDLKTSLRDRARLRRLSPDRRRVDEGDLRLRGAGARPDAHAAQPRGDVRRRRRSGPDLGAEPTLSRSAPSRGWTTRLGRASCCSSTWIRTTSAIRRSTRTKSRTRRASSSRSPSGRRSRTTRSSASGSRRSATWATASRWTTPAAATPGWARSRTWSRTSSSSTSR